MRFPKSLPRRAVFAAMAIAVATTLLPDRASAQSAWPSRPIKLIVPFGPGASNDTIARVLAAKLSERIGQAVVVENKVGAGGAIGTAYVANQPADGYNLLMGSNPLTMAHLIGVAGKKPPYDPVKQFQPIGQVGAAPLVVVVSHNVKATSLREFAEQARSSPGGLNFGSAGNGSLNHLGVELLTSALDIKLLHVPYTGLGAATTALLSGDIHMLLPSYPAGMPLVRAGQVRALAVTGAQRSTLLPDVPTAMESGVPGFQLEAWWGLLGPAGMPAPVTKRLNDELNTILAMSDIRELLAREGATPNPGTPEDLGKLISAEVLRWSQVVKHARIE